MRSGRASPWTPKFPLDQEWRYITEVRNVRCGRLAAEGVWSPNRRILAEYRGTDSRALSRLDSQHRKFETLNSGPTD